MGAFAFDRMCWDDAGSGRFASRRREAPPWLWRSCLATGFARRSRSTARSLRPLEKIPLKMFKSAQQALRAGIDDLRAGDAKSSVEALKYAAAGGQSLAQWKLGRMYAQGQGVPHDDFQAYQYFDQLDPELQ